MEILNEINRGGFGVVERARLVDGSIVARKTFSPSVGFTSNEEKEKLRRRFEREVKYMSSMKSNAICPVLDFDLSDDKPWFTMPLADRTLHEEIANARATGVMPTEALADILNGLEEIHRLGLVHRDLKPKNVLLIDGTWRLADFGLVLPPSGSTTMLTTASAWGTEAYAAPEQALQFHSVTAAADVYAFGCILHDLFGTGQRIPFAKHTAAGKIGAVIERCTDTKPDKRFESISSLREALSVILSETSGTGSAISDTAEDWATKISDGGIKDSNSLVQLVRYVNHEADSEERRAIYHAIAKESIVELHSIDPGAWKSLMAEYCEWIATSGFDFAFCDTLAQRLVTVAELGDTEIKATSIVAAARMAESHNRWFAMERVVSLSGSELDDDAADRLAIDIRAFGLKRVFRACAERINKKLNVYHPAVMNALGTES